MVARRLLVGKKVRVSPGFITHTEYVVIIIIVIIIIIHYSYRVIQSATIS